MAKVVQIAVTGDEEDNFLYVLLDDGSLWMCINNKNWEEVAVPQRAVE